MRRLLICFALLALACRAFTLPGFVQPIPTQGVHLSGTATATHSPSPLLPRGEAKELSPTPTLWPDNTSHLDDLSFDVIAHPDGKLYIGDLVSFEVIAPPGMDAEGRSVEIWVDPPQGEKLKPEKFSNYGIANRQQATFTWAWDTRELPAGEHTLSFSIQPDGITWTETVFLNPQNELPLAEQTAQWATARSACCVFHYITGTAAERDLPVLLQEADAQAQSVNERFRIDFTEPITVTLIPRLLGHGGFTGNDINISYLDRNYAGSLFSQVLHHEMVHFVDNRLGGELRPTILVEGLAVYLSGGHFKPEPLLPRAAALLTLPPYSPGAGLGWYLPLQQLADNFYPSQHEIGYLEAGALVEYMVMRWGWEQFMKFYRDIHPHESQSQARAIDQALKRHFNVSFIELERDFLETLRNQEITPDLKEDIRLTVLFYDTVRRYQLCLDPSANFQTAWLPDNVQMRQRGIVADYLRHPSTPLNVALEMLLMIANDYLRRGAYLETDNIVQVVNGVLDMIEPVSPSEENLQGSFVFQANETFEKMNTPWKPQPLQIRKPLLLP